MQKLTAPQEKMLRLIVATNGGGVFVGFNECTNAVKIMRRLEAFGLIQGKAGSPSWAVHTRPGLEWVREKDKPT